MKATCHSPIKQPQNGWSKSGSSEITWTFKGVYDDHGQCVVVVEAASQRDAANSKPDGTTGVFPSGKDGAFCELTLDTGDLNTWSVRVATPKDAGHGKGVVFQGGTGFIGKSAA